MRKILEVKNVTKIYKVYKSNIDRLKEVFLKKNYHKEFISNLDITFDLFEGETLGIIGVNGAGKSTILKIIAGVINQTSGEVLRHGRITALLELGTGFNQELTGHENIYLNGTLIGMSNKEIDSRIEDIIAFTELGDYIYEPMKSYSSGMSMRLAFSIAIFSEPRTLIVDEALSVGDAHFAAKCTRALRQRKEQNMSIIYVSHDLNSLKLLCDRVILLNHGKVVNEGMPEDVINTYNFLISKLNDTDEKMSIKSNNKSSFGTFDVEITKVSVKGENSNSNVISSGENTTIRVLIASKKDVPNMTVGIMIRDKFGQDIFGTNTYHYKLNIDFKANKEYVCNYIMPINIGNGNYSITAAVHSQSTHLSNCSHWLDNAAGFEVAGINGQYFTGMCKLNPEINFTLLQGTV
ncbi:MAG: lipopolysaccharide transport system ATP-binding protein [Sulfurimonas sp.]|jgi:lipopolysaccharide transport system ATP-binding protein|uniref:ABC transporter ATP-binding protein n=1 Tax=Sulfurimonas sp. TaxID=2022749 RepID=UPI0039E2614A